MALLDDFMTVLDIAAGNAGIVTRQQLLEAGLSARSISGLAAGERAMAPLGGGLYLVLALEDMQFGAQKVALQRVDSTRSVEELARDPLGKHSGVLSHHAAAYIHGLPDLPDEMHVITPVRRRLSGVTTHTETLSPDEVKIVEGLPVTTMERTTYDLGQWPMDGEHRSRWVNFCLYEGGMTLDRARTLLGPSAEDTLMYLPAGV